jgi:hypothetical protein
MSGIGLDPAVALSRPYVKIQAKMIFSLYIVERLQFGETP